MLGRPVAHSLSPRLHGAAYAALGLVGWRYDAVDVGVDGLADVVRGLDATWAGVSVTMPLKQAVVPLLDDVGELAAAVGAVNTVVVTPTPDGVHLRGENTDVHGVLAALAGAGASSVMAGVVLGAGATAASAVAALVRAGCTDPVVVGRSAERADDVLAAARRLGGEPRFVGWDSAAVPPLLATADAVVSTVPGRAADVVADRLSRAVRGVLLDVVYDPWPTALARAWSTAGGVVVPGAEMLLQQAAEQVQLFTGVAAPLDVMRAAVGPPIG